MNGTNNPSGIPDGGARLPTSTGQVARDVLVFQGLGAGIERFQGSRHSIHLQWKLWLVTWIPCSTNRVSLHGAAVAIAQPAERVASVLVKLDDSIVKGEVPISLATESAVAALDRFRGVAEHGRDVAPGVLAPPEMQVGVKGATVLVCGKVKSRKKGAGLAVVHAMTSCQDAVRADQSARAPVSRSALDMGQV